jgi:hypothetical protein
MASRAHGKKVVMTRRDFLKRAAAIAVAGAFPLPAPADPLTPTIHAGTSFLDAGFLQAFADETLVYWRGAGVVIAGDTFMEEMRRQWAQLGSAP